MAGQHLRRRLWLWTPPIIYMIAIFHFSSESRPLPALTEHVWDKLLHTVEYGGLGFLLARAFRGEGVRWLPALLLAMAATSLYGASDEWHQMFVPVRSSDIQDWIGDTIGGTLGAAAYTAVALLSSTRERSG